MYEQDFLSRVKLTLHAERTRRDELSALGKELPQDVSEKLQEIHALEDEVMGALRHKEEELVQLVSLRGEWRSLLAAVHQWMQRSQGQLQARISDIPSTRQAHEVRLLFRYTSL